MAELKIWQLNCHKSFDVNTMIQTELAESIEAKDVAVLLLQEPHIGRGQKASLKVKDMITHGLEGGRSCVVVARKLDFSIVNSLSGPDVVVGRLKRVGKKDLLIGSIYCDGNEPMISDSLERIMDHSVNKDLPVILAMDANAKSTLWGSDRSNARGLALENWMLQRNLCTRNSGSAFTYFRRNVESVIDVTVVSEELSDQVTDWKVSEAYMASDHRRIEFNLENVFIEEFWARNLAKADWDQFKRLLGDHAFLWPDVWTVRMLETESKSLSGLIKEALNVVAPLRRCKNRQQDLPHWYSNKLKNMKMHVQKLYKILCKEVA